MAVERMESGWIGLAYDDEADLFVVLAKLADEHGWELSRRDPGPSEQFMAALESGADPDLALDVALQHR